MVPEREMMILILNGYPLMEEWIAEHHPESYLDWYQQIRSILEVACMQATSLSQECIGRLVLPEEPYEIKSHIDPQRGKIYRINVILPNPLTDKWLKKLKQVIEAHREEFIYNSYLE